MPTITVPDVQTFEVPDDKKLVLAIEDAGIDILHRCGGNAKCTTCRVEIISGDPGAMNDAERERLAREVDLAENIRLSCQIRCHSDLTINVPYRLSSTELTDAGPRPTD